MFVKKSLYSNRPAVRIALEYLNKHIEEKTWKDGDRLPSTRELAACAGVSMVSMHNAVAILKDQKILHARTRAGITLGQPSILQNLPSKEMLRRRIIRDIAEGRFKDSELLPSSKELGEIYGISFTTLKKVFEKLIQDGILLRYRKRFKIVTRKTSTLQPEIVFVLSNELLAFVEKFDVVKNVLNPMIRALEEECSRRNVRFLMRGVAHSHTILKGTYNLLGCICLFQAYYPELDVINTLVRKLISGGKPCVLFNDKKQLLEPLLAQNKNIYSSSDSVFDIGCLVGKFLIDKGHAKICFFSHEPGLDWAEPRLMGLRHAFESAGFSDAVTIFYAHNVNGADPGKGIVGTGFERYSAAAAQKLALIKQQKQIMQKEFGDSRFAQRVIGEMEEMEIAFSGTWDRFFPVMEQAYALKDVTAWVVAEDQIAVHALFPFCKLRHIRIPQDISVIGFNNIPDALLYGLTSYDFNIAASARFAVDLLFAPDRRHAYVNSKDNTIHINGYIVDRGSVRKV